MSAAASEAGQPRPGRIGPREAAQLAAGARAAGVTRGSARVVLELLLRHTRGTLAVQRSTRWIADNTGPSRSTIVRAIDALVAAGLVVVAIPGTGRTVAAYLVNVELLRILTDSSPDVTSLTLTVQPGEPSESDATPGVAERHPRGSRTPPQGCQNATPGVSKRYPRPRAYARAPGLSLPLYSKDPLVPQTPPTSPPSEDPSPAAGGAPFSQTGDIDQPCAHGRSVAQGGCRACGTTARQLVDQRERSTRLTELERQRRDQAERRAREAELKAASTPPPPDLRASIHKPPKAKP